MELMAAPFLPVASVLWQQAPQAWVLTVVCKATFALLPGTSPLAAEQEPVAEEDGYWNDDPARSLHRPNDLAPLKMRDDVVLVGSAFAPGGVPVRSLVTRLGVGPLEKVIECCTDRVVGADGRVQEGAGFSRMSLLYERASGGPGTVNPVGIRRGARDSYGRATLPNLQPVGTRVSGPDVVVDPIGFGPISPRWPARRDKLGARAGGWPASDWTAQPLPDDIDRAFFNAAPPDQQIAELRDNERIVLENLHHDHPRLVTALSGVHPCAFLDGRPSGPVRLSMHADTLLIDTDRATCTVTWRRQIPLERRDEPGRVLVALEHPGQTLTWTEVLSIVEAQDRPDLDTVPPAALAQTGRGSSSDLSGASDPRRAPMPFSASVPAPRPSVAPPARMPATQTIVFHAVQTEQALPFGAATGLGATAPPSAAAPAWAALSSRPPEPSSIAAPMAPPIVPPAVPVAPVPAPPSLVRPPSLADGSVATANSPWATGASAPTFARTAAPVPPIATAPVEAASRPEPVPTSAPSQPNDVLELVWFDADSAPRLRRIRAFKDILEALDRAPVDRDLDEPGLASAPMDSEDRREVFEILAKGAAEDAGGIDRALDAAIRKDGKFVPQLTLLAADMEFHFDELEALRATVATAKPFVTPTDEALKTATDAARELLETADELTPKSVALAMTTRIREAFAATKRAVPETHLEDQTDRALLSQRRYQKRIVFGGAHLRCLVICDGVATPGYLPESLAKKLPMYRRFRARLIAEVHQQVDQYETHHAALRIVALTRVSARPKRA